MSNKGEDLHKAVRCDKKQIWDQNKSTEQKLVAIAWKHHLENFAPKIILGGGRSGKVHFSSARPT